MVARTQNCEIFGPDHREFMCPKKNAALTVIKLDIKFAHIKQKIWTTALDLTWDPLNKQGTTAQVMEQTAVWIRLKDSALLEVEAQGASISTPDSTLEL